LKKQPQEHMNTLHSSSPFEGRERRNKIAKRFASAKAANSKKRLGATEKKQNRGKFHDRQVILL